jgi:uncharacterized protein
MSEERAIEVSDQSDRNRFVVTVDGEEAGAAHYAVRDGVVVFTHTAVEPRWEGKGVGSALARGALDAVVGSGGTFIARCPFIAAYVERHPEYAASALD